MTAAIVAAAFSAVTFAATAGAQTDDDHFTRASDATSELIHHAVGSPSWQIWPSHELDQVVGLDTWLLITDGWNEEMAASTSGAVTVGARATPILAEWHFTDETGGVHIVTCDGPGEHWGPELLHAPACGKTWEQSSAVSGLVEMKVRIEYEVGLFSSGTSDSTSTMLSPFSEPVQLTVSEVLSYLVAPDSAPRGSGADGSGTEAESGVGGDGSDAGGDDDEDDHDEGDDGDLEQPDKIVTCELAGNVGVSIPGVANGGLNGGATVVFEHMPDGTIIATVIRKVGAKGGYGGHIGAYVDTGDGEYGAIAGAEANLGAALGVVETYELPEGTTPADFARGYAVDKVVPDGVGPFPIPGADRVEGALGGGLEEVSDGFMLENWAEAEADHLAGIPGVEIEAVEGFSEAMAGIDVQMVGRKYADGRVSYGFGAAVDVGAGYAGRQTIPGTPTFVTDAIDSMLPESWEGDARASFEGELIVGLDGTMSFVVTVEVEVNGKLVRQTWTFDYDAMMPWEIDIADVSLDELHKFERDSARQVYDVETKDAGSGYAFGGEAAALGECTTATRQQTLQSRPATAEG